MPPPAPIDEPHAAETEHDRLVQELAATHEYLQSVIAQQEAANEELQSANEEVQSANEELQSINEELETSKEEIQSSNEELATVNDELNNRNAQLSQANNDLLNLLGNIQMPIVMLGSDLCVRRFTPAAEILLKLTAHDVGRPLADIKLKLANLPNLEPILAAVLDTGSNRELDVQDRRGRWFSLRLRPYKTLDNKIDGVVVMLVDIDSLKRAHAYTESIVATVREPLVVLTADLRVLTASASFYEIYRVTPEETLNRFLYDLGNGQWNIPALRGLLDSMLTHEGQIIDFEVEHDFEHIGIKMMRLNARRLAQIGEHDPLILLAIEDVTEHEQQAKELRNYATKLEEADRRKNEFLAMLAHELRNPLAPIRNAIQVLRLSKSGEESGPYALEMMERQIVQMVRLVDDLLDVSRISQGKIELRKERIELASVVHHAVEAVRPLSAEHGP